MVSLRQKEKDCEIAVMDCNEIPWDSIRRSLEYSLRSRGSSDDESEELADSAIVAAYEACRGFTSIERARREARSQLASVRRETFEQQSRTPLLSDYQSESIVTDRRKSLLCPLQHETTEAMEIIRNRRETERLLRRYSWLIGCSSVVAEKTTEQRRRIEPGDTWQAIPPRYEYRTYRKAANFATAYRSLVPELSECTEYTPGVEKRDLHSFRPVGMAEVSYSKHRQELSSSIPDWYVARFSGHKDNVSESVWFIDGLGI